MSDDAILLRVKELIKIFDLNISKFAAKVDIDKGNMSKIISGGRSIGKNTAKKISDAFDINLSWLLTGIGPMEKERDTPIVSDCDISSIKEKLIAEKQVVPYSIHQEAIDKIDRLNREIGSLENQIKQLEKGGKRIRSDTRESPARKQGKLAGE